MSQLAQILNQQQQNSQRQRDAAAADPLAPPDSPHGGDKAQETAQRAVRGIFQRTGVQLFDHARSRLRHEIFRFFDDAESRPAAYWFSLYFMFLICFSTMSFLLQTERSLSSTRAQAFAWAVIETIVVAQFTADYLIRLATTPSHKAFFLSVLNAIDFLSILPFWIELAIITSGGTKTGISGLAVVRILRLARVLRLFKLGRNSQQLKLVTTAFARSRDGIVLLCFLFTLAAVLFAAAVFFSESAYCTLDPDTRLWLYSNATLHPDEVSPYQSVIGSMWWAIVTMTTVGYGDAYPITPPGKVVGVITMLSGLLVVAFPITIIGSNLSEVYAEFKKAKLEDDKAKQAARDAKRLKRAANKEERNKKLLKARVHEHDVETMVTQLTNTMTDLKTFTSIVHEKLPSLETAEDTIRDVSRALKELADSLAAGPPAPRAPRVVVINDNRSDGGRSSGAAIGLSESSGAALIGTPE